MPKPNKKSMVTGSGSNCAHYFLGLDFFFLGAAFFFLAAPFTASLRLFL